MAIQVEILNPEWSRSFEADAVWLPGTVGEFEVLQRHAPIISTLTAGKVKWRIGSQEDSLEISSGAVRLINDKMQICVEQ